METIKEILYTIRDWIDGLLRRCCFVLSPDQRFIAIISMLILFGAGSIYMTVSSIYHIGKGSGESLQIEHIEQLELQLHQKTDSINQLKYKQYYEYE